MSEARLKPGGVVLIVGFALAIIAFGVWSIQQNKNKTAGGGDVADKGGGQTPQGNGGPHGPTTEPAEPGVQLVQGTFEEVGRQGVPQVAGKGGYAWDANDPTVVFPINVWAGWGPIVAANDGFKAGSPNSVFKKYGFKVELRLIDDPGQAANAYAGGQAHTMWGTLDMIALFAPQLQKAGLVPKVYQQIDWSRGGDGVVVRGDIKNVGDLRGKTIALCQNSPSHFYILHLLRRQGMTARDVKFRFTSNAFGASALFAADRSVDACVSWAPDIYTLTADNPRAKLLSTTVDASNVIADVWAVRPDFAAEHPEVIEGLVRGIFEGYELLKQNPDRVAALLAQGYGLPVEECKAMLPDAFPTNLGDNVSFFTGTGGASFQGVWENAVQAYTEYGAIEGAPVPASQVMDGSIIQKLKAENAFPGQKPEQVIFEPLKVDPSQIEAALPEVLRIPRQIRFKPNSAELDMSDETIEGTLAEIKRLKEEFGGARIIIEGNVDTSQKSYFQSMGSRVFTEMAQAARQLSESRANTVRQEVLKRLDNKDPNQILAFGNGWDNPVDPHDQSKNRRVDIRVLPVE